MTNAVKEKAVYYPDDQKEKIFNRPDDTEEEKDPTKLTDLELIEVLDESAVSDEIVEESEEELEEAILNENIDDNYKIYMTDVCRYKLLTPEEEKETALRAMNGDAKAKEKLIQCNLRLVVSVAKRFQTEGSLELMDLIQEGNIGLCKAVEKYDVRKGFKFSTYAVWWIIQTITRYINTSFTYVRTPDHAAHRLTKIRRAISDLMAEKNSTAEITLEEIAERAGESVNFVKDTYYLLYEAVSLDKQHGEDEDLTLADSIPDHVFVSPEDAAIKKDLDEKVMDQINTLPERERDIVKMRFGLDGHEPATLEKVGAIYGLTRERVRQLENKALRKLKCKRELRLLVKEYDNFGL